MPRPRQWTGGVVDAMWDRWEGLNSMIMTDPERYMPRILEVIEELKSYRDAGIMPDDMRVEFDRHV